MPIRWKLLLAISIPVLLIYIAIGGREFFALKEKSLEDQRRITEGQAMYYAARFDGTLREIAQIARSTATILTNRPELTESQLYELINLNMDQEPLVYGSSIAYEPNSFSPNVELFAPYGFRDGDEYSSLDIGRDAYDYTTWPWYAEIRDSGEGRWTEPYFDEGAGNVLMCTYSAPFFDENGAFRGVATVDIKIVPLQLEIQIEGLESGRTVIVSRDGRFISHPDESIIMTTLTERAEITNTPILLEVERNIAQGLGGFLLIPTFPTNVSHWINYTPVESAGWSFAILIPESNIMAPVYASLGRLLVSLAVGLFVMLLAIAIVSVLITKPVARLADGVRALAGGDMDAQVVGVESRDELGDLARGFNTMVTKLDEHVDALAKESAAREAVEGQLRVASEVQQGLLPKDRLELTGYEIAGWNEPADETGGDYFDWQALPDGKWIVSIADVTGHGIGPALVTAFCRAYSRASFPSATEMGPCMSRVNNLIHEDITAGKFVTFAATIIDPASNSLELLSAGHGPILVYRAQNQMTDEYIADGLPLGVMEDADYGAPHQIHLNDGDMLVLLTDGYFEWANKEGEQFGTKRLSESIIRSAAHTPEEIIKAMHEDVLRFSGGTSQDDDLTMVVIKRCESA